MSQYHGMQPFWFWNGDMKKEEILRQIDEMHAQGITGFIIHPRQGMEIPYMSEEYFKRVRLAVERAGEYDMEVWLYDEYPYPSGVTAGQVTLDHPEYQCKMLELKELEVHGGEEAGLDVSWGTVLMARAYRMEENDTICWNDAIDVADYIGTAYQEEVFQLSGLSQYNHKRFFTGIQCKRLLWTAPEGTWKIMVFSEVLMEGFKYFKTYIDTMNPDAIRYFIQTTHEVYKKELGDQFGKTIRGIFTDEITAFPPERPWSPLLCGRMKDKYKTDLIPWLPVLFGYDMGEETAKIRYMYRNTAAEAFVESYDKQILAWCHENHMLYIGEKPVLRSSELEFVDYTGIDAGHQKAGEKPFLTPGKYRANGKIASSAAHLYGRKGSLCEAFHSIGWGMTIRDMKWMFDWLTVHGIDWFVLHAFFYTANGLKKHDAPPSSFYQMPWWKNLNLLSTYLQKQQKLLAEGTPVIRILLADPVTSAWTAPDVKEEERRRGIFGEIQKTMLEERLNYYVIDPDLIAESTVEQKNGMTVLNVRGEDYACLVLPAMKNMEDACFVRVKEFADQGGMIFAACGYPVENIEHKDVSGWMKEYFAGAGAGCCAYTAEELCAQLRQCGYGYELASDTGDVREVLSVEYERPDGSRYYFLTNTGEDNVILSGDVIRGTLSLAPFESVVYDKEKAVLNHAEKCFEICLDNLSECRLEEPNLFRMGEWTFSCADGQTAEYPVETMPVIDQLEKGKLKIDVLVRKQFGCPKILLLEENAYIYECEFVIDDALKKNELYLVMEPGAIKGDWEIYVNGKKKTEKDFTLHPVYFPDNQGSEISDCLCSGKNVIRVNVKAKKTYDGLISPLYIAGDFAVERKDGLWYLKPFTGEASLKDCIRGKIPFYAGTADYSFAVDADVSDAGKCAIIEIKDSWFEDAAEVVINGKSLGHEAWFPYRWQIPQGLIRPGKNEAELKVTGTAIGVLEGQRYDRMRHAYESLTGYETHIEDYEEVVHK